MSRITLRGTLAAGIATLFLFSATAFAQDDDSGPQTQGDDARYLRVSYVKFKPGQRESAMEMITEHFVPASKKAGLPGPILAIHFQTGKWDAAFVWNMEGGMADLEWYRSPNGVKWRAAFDELAGGEEAAAELLKTYGSKVAESFSEVGHHHVPEAD
jgi:hypothetical protein